MCCDYNSYLYKHGGQTSNIVLGNGLASSGSAWPSTPFTNMDAFNSSMDK